MRHFLKLSTQIAKTQSKLSQCSGTRRTSNRYYNTAVAAETTQDPERAPPSEKVVQIVNEISNLTLLEVADLTDVLRQKLGIQGMPSMAMMMPGMRFGVKGGFGEMGGAVVEEKKEEKKGAEAKTVYNLKLDGFDAAGKIKVIKEVRSFTSLGLKEAKELVEKAPTVMKSGVTKEEAEKIIEKMKEVGAKVSME